MTSYDLANTLFEKLGGIEKHNLNSLLQFSDSTEDYENSYSPSDYYDIESFIKLTKNLRQAFSSLTLNIESIQAKFDLLLAFVENISQHNFYFDALFLQETWLTDQQCDQKNIKRFDIPGYQTIPLGRKCGRKGGLIIYLHDKYKFVLRENLYKASNDWEGLFVDVTHCNKEKINCKITLANIYRPPRENNSDASISRFLNPYSIIHKKLAKENSTLVTSGDFNINLLNLTSREKFQEYFDVFIGNGSLPMITHPTRFSKKKATLIDQIYCRFSKYTSHRTSGIIATKISDHLPCFSIMNFATKDPPKPKYINVQRKGPKEIENFKKEITEQLKKCNFNTDPFADPNENYILLEKIIIEARVKCFPIIRMRYKKYKHKLTPWITFGLLNSIKYRDKLYVKLIKTSLASTKYLSIEKEYKDFCSVLQSSLRKAKSDYYHKQFQDSISDIKKTWSKINEVLCRKSKRAEMPDYFLDGNKVITENVDIANCFNNFFANIGPTLANSIKGPIGQSYKDFLKTKIESHFSFNTVDNSYVLNLINKLKPKPSFGHDGLSSIMLKGIATSVSPILTCIINQSLCTGIFPQSLKIAKIIPIFKKENPHITDNYRPVSLLPIISKIFEKVVFIQVYDYFTENDLLYKSQYGFRKLHSTELAALEFTDKIVANLEQGKLPLAIFLDLSKAFDTIDHNILLDKLRFYGISGKALEWFRSYLQKRKQYVQYGDSVSSMSYIQTGVPQGSILGPLLFIIYMNDIAAVTNKFHFTLYADDTSLLEPLCSFAVESNESYESISKNINNELKLITNWLSLNKLSLNAKKTKMMVFHHKQKNLCTKSLKLYINSKKIECVKEFNFLGVMLDENLNWKSHVQKVSSKVAGVAGTLSRLKRFLPSNILKTIYNALIQPHLNLGVLLWGINIGRIYKLQKWAVRAITSSKYNSHTAPIFKKLKILRIHELYRLNLLKFYFKYKKNQLPAYFHGMFEEVFLLHNHDTRHKNDPVPGVWKSIAAKNSIRFALPAAVAIAPKDILDDFDNEDLKINSFSKKAKMFFINQYGTECHIKSCYVCNDPQTKNEQSE